MKKNRTIRLCALIISALPLAFGCKKDGTKMPPNELGAKTAFMAKAQQFAMGKMPLADYEKLDWARAVEYNIEGTGQMLRVPLRGNTAPGQKAAYLTYNNNAFSGNYFELGGNAVTTQSLDNARKCVAPVTGNGQVRDYKVYENGRELQDVTGMAAVGIIGPPQFFYNNYSLYCLITILRLGQSQADGGGTGNSPQGVASYLEAPPIGGETGGGGFVVNYDYLNGQLSPSDEQYQWLVANPLEAAQVSLYLQTSTQPDRVAIAQKHLQMIVTDADYMNFVTNHTNTTNDPLKVWWEDATWLANPNNFNFDFEDRPAIAPSQDLTTAEKLLIVQHPIEAWIIRGNGNDALAETKEMFPGVRMLNNKADAFRHAYWMARNTKSVGSGLALLFGAAHESEVPPQHILEQQMDLHNNSVGASLYQSGMGNQQLSALAMNAVIVGACWYLKPINYNEACFDGCPSNPLGTHGITPQTQIVTTNQ